MISLAGADTDLGVKRQLATALVEKRRRQAQQGGRPIDLLTWSAVYRRLLKPGVLFDLTRHPYLAEIYSCQAQRMVIYKAGQMGASEYAVSRSLYSCAVREATTLYVFPTDRHVSDFSKARFGPAIEASPYLGQMVVEARGTGGRRGSDQVTLKRVGNAFLYFRGAQVQPDGRAPQLKSIDADVLIEDEKDEMDPRASPISRKRLGHSDIAEMLSISTPSYAGTGIHIDWTDSDQREWHVPCGHCGEWQPLSIQQVVIEWDQIDRPLAWHGMEEERAWVACRRCGREVDRLAQGEWVAAYPGRNVVGYHLTKLFSAQVELVEIVQGLDTTNETERKEAFNQDLGEPYTPRGGQMTDNVLDECRRAYGHGPVQGEQPSMGVDVGKVLHVVIRGPAQGDKGERPQRWAGEVDSFEQAGNLLRQYNVGTCVVDALPETTKAREFQAAHNGGADFAHGTVWLAFYGGNEGQRYAEPARWNEEQGTVMLDRTRTIDQTLSRFYDKTNTLPADAKGIRDYYAHLKALVRVLEKANSGEMVARYVETGPDHLAHAENYCTAASMRESWSVW